MPIASVSRSSSTVFFFFFFVEELKKSNTKIEGVKPNPETYESSSINVGECSGYCSASRYFVQRSRCLYIYSKIFINVAIIFHRIREWWLRFLFAWNSVFQKHWVYSARRETINSSNQESDLSVLSQDSQQCSCANFQENFIFIICITNENKQI